MLHARGVFFTKGRGGGGWGGGGEGTNCFLNKNSPLQRYSPDTAEENASEAELKNPNIPVLAEKSKAVYVYCLPWKIFECQGNERLSILEISKSPMMFYLLDSLKCSQIQIPSGPPRSFQTELFQISRSPPAPAAVDSLRQKMRNFPQLIFHPFQNFLLIRFFQLYTVQLIHSENGERS